MPMYRHDRLPGGSHYVRRTTWEDEAAGAIVGGAASAAGWLIGSGISGVRNLARNSQDRKLVRAATALDEASESEDDDQFLAQAREFTGHYPHLADGYAALAQAFQRKGRFDGAIESLDRAIQLGLDETQAHMLRADIYDDADKPGKAIQEYTILAQTQEPELRQVSLLSRARLLMQIGDLDQALKDANNAIATLPDEAGYTVRGHVFRSKGDFESCIQDYSRAIQLCPDSPDLLENRAEVYEHLGRVNEANADRAAAAAASATPGMGREDSPATSLAKDDGASDASAVSNESLWVSILPAILILLAIFVLLIVLFVVGS